MTTNMQRFIKILTLCVSVALNILVTNVDAIPSRRGHVSLGHSRHYYGHRLEEKKYGCQSLTHYSCKVPPYGRMKPICVPKTYVCDGHTDCPMGDDERYCKCQQPPAVPDAYIIPESTVLKTLRKYECNYGFVPVPKGVHMYTTCQSNGLWSPVLFSCVKDCGSPPSILNADIGPGFTQLDSTRSYHCKLGYVQVPATANMVTTCESSGHWSATSFSCVVNCGHPPPVANAHVGQGSTLSGSTLAYFCNHGFVPTSNAVSNEITCQTSGHWSLTSFTCFVDCGAPPPVSNAMISPESTTAFSTGTYVCANGYTSINGENPTIKCLTTGNWESTPFKCTETTIGETCSDSVPCVGTGAECIEGLCLCGPLYRYNNTIGDCQQVCTTITDDFEETSPEYISYNNHLQSTPGITTYDACKQLCIDDPECLSFDLHGTNCHRSRYTIFMLQDIDSDLVVQTVVVRHGSRKCA